MPTDHARLAGFATRSMAAPLGGAVGGPTRRPARRHRRKSAKFMLPLGLTPPEERAASLDDQILCAVASMGVATEADILSFIARDRWFMAHKALWRMTREGLLVQDRPVPETRGIAPLAGTVLSVRIASPVSAVAKVLPDGDSAAVRIVAFGALARELLLLRPDRRARFLVRWLRTHGRRSAKAVRIAT